MGLFSDRNDAEEAISQLQDDLDVDSGSISYLYKNNKEEVVESPADAEDASRAKTGAKAGAAIGALAGIAAVAGIIPVVGPLVVAGPLASALGITTAVGTTAAGAVTGAAAGGIIGALVDMGVGKERAEYYSTRISSGDILVSVDTEEYIYKEVARVMEDCGASEVSTYNIT